MPKSSTFTVPPMVSMMFAGFRSRCTTFARCAVASPSAICAPIAAAHSTGS